MLGTLDLDRIFRHAQSRGYVFVEIYAEERSEYEWRSLNHHDDVRLDLARGIALRCFDGHRTLHFTSQGRTTDSILKALDNPTSVGICLSPPEVALEIEVNSAGRYNITDKARILSTFARSLDWPEDLHFPLLRYRDETTRFEVANSQGVYEKGLQQAARIVTQWYRTKDGVRTPHRWEASRKSNDALLEYLADPSPLQKMIYHCERALQGWPAPRGEMPVYWSNDATAKLLFQFLRGFEGDLFLRNLSFLRKAETFPLHFGIEESAPSQSRVDQEGAGRRSLLFFDGERPRALACNHTTALELEIPSTGHGRRDTFFHPPTVSFWEPRVLAEKTVENPLRALPCGIAVHDLEVEDFCTRTANIVLHLKSMELIHQGETGELVQPLRLQTNLLKLLHSFDHFSAQSAPVGLPVVKRGQELIVEMESPSAVSPAYFMEGHVPLSNYW